MGCANLPSVITRGVGAPHPCPLGVGGKLPLPLYADVRLHIPMAHIMAGRGCGGCRTKVDFRPKCKRKRVAADASAHDAAACCSTD